MSYQVVTVVNRPPTAWYYLWSEFHESLRRFNCTPTIIGLQGEYGHWGGLASKPKWLYRAIQEKRIDTKYMIFCDSWDLIFAADTDEVFDVYKCFDSPIVVSAESNCFPADTKEDYDKLNPDAKYRYLNSGFIVGETQAILTCLEAMDLPNLPDDYYDPEKNCNIHPNDQYEWQKIFLKQPVQIKLDYEQLLCQTLHDAKIEDFDLTKDRIRNTITNSYPCSLHFNGGSKDNMGIREPILRHLKLL